MSALRGKLIVRLDSALLIGGYGGSGSSVDAQSAKDEQGRPLVPASTLKGALREACTRLLRAKSLRACTPIDPCSSSAPCLICEIFGTSGPKRAGITMPEEERDENEAGEEGRLRIGNAVHKTKSAFSLRPGVAIDRTLGSAVPGVYFEREVMDEPGAELEAPVWGDLSPEAEKIFQDSLALVTGIGNSRSRGLGQVSLSFVPNTGGSPGIRIEAGGDQSPESALLIADAKEPLVLSPRPSANSIYRTLSYIPGSTLRGAIAHALLRGGTKAEDLIFQRAFVDPEHCLRFSDALPSNPRNNDELPYPLPPSTLRCKHADDEKHRAKRRNALVDTFVQQALARAVLKKGGVWNPPTCSVEGCGQPLRPVDGYFPELSLNRRIVTRLGRDICTGSALPGMLYSVEQLLPGARFIGTVTGINAGTRSLLEQASEVLVGQGRSRGQGLVHIHICPRTHIQAQLSARRKVFEASVSTLWDYALTLGADLPKDPAGLVALMLRTDLCLPAGETAETALARSIFEGKASTLLLGLQGVSRRSGWDEGYSPSGARGAASARPMKALVKAGSVFLFQGEVSDAKLAQLESGGIGEDRHLGLGNLVFYPEIFRKGWSA